MVKVVSFYVVTFEVLRCSRTVRWPGGAKEVSGLSGYYHVIMVYCCASLSFLLGCRGG